MRHDKTRSRKRGLRESSRQAGNSLWASRWQRRIPHRQRAVRGSEVVLLDILEILVGAMLDFLAGSFIADNDAMLVHLQH